MSNFNEKLKNVFQFFGEWTEETLLPIGYYLWILWMCQEPWHIYQTSEPGQVSLWNFITLAVGLWFAAWAAAGIFQTRLKRES